VRPELEKQLLNISARQMDRRLKEQKTQRQRKIYGRTKPGYLLKHHIAVKTDRWDAATPGFTEVDLVSHAGHSASGEFAHTLNVPDIHTTWTESRAVLGRGEEAVQRALNEIATVLPFALLGADSGNGSAFINWHLKDWCEQRHIQLTRGRPYKKDDNAYIEHTPFERVRECVQADPQKVAKLEELRKRLDPFQLSSIIERKLERLARLTNRRLSPKAAQQTVAESAPPTRPANGHGKAAALGNPANYAGFPLSHRRNNNKSSVTFQMFRQPQLRLHS
jgi:hypothetical protein